MKKIFYSIISLLFLASDGWAVDGDEVYEGKPFNSIIGQTITLTGTGTLNGLDAIDATTESTLESALDVGGDLSGTVGNAAVSDDSHSHGDSTISDTITVGASGSVNDAAIPSGITRDTEWDTAAEINAATTDADFLTGNQSITLSGDASGSGTTAITVVVADDSHSHTATTLPSHDSITGAGTVDTASEIQGVAMGGDLSGTIGSASESDPDFNAWDKDYADLINTPTIPDSLSDLSDDSTHRLVTDTEKSIWNAKQNALVADTDYLTPSTAASTYEPIKGSDDNYVTDAEKIVIGNTSGTNTGDQTLSGLGGVPTSRSLTINGTAYDLTADRSWTIAPMVYPDSGIALSTGTAWGSSITDNSSNWNTAYGWGNHASAGYLTAVTGSGLDAVFTGASGFLKKTGAATYTLDTSAYLTTVDISTNTNLSGDTEIVLTGDALSIGSAISRDSEWNALHFLTSTSETALSSESNLGALTTGFLLGTVADGTSTVSSVSTAAGINAVTTDHDFLYQDSLHIPFYKSDSTLDTISLTSDSKIPFYKSTGVASNIPLTS